MAGIRILVAEHDPALAAALRDALHGLGYGVDGPAPDGKTALDAAKTIKPDLALVDARLPGRPSGIETGSRLLAQHVPVIFLTETADTDILDQVKETSPFGFIHQPLLPGDLKIAIEIALFRHQSESRLEQNRLWFAAALDSVRDGLITADRDGLITYLNPAAEALTLWKKSEARGRPLADVCVSSDIDTGRPLECIGLKALREGKAQGDDSRVVNLTDKAGRTKEVSAAAAPILPDSRRVEGVILVFRDVTRRRLHERHHRSVEKMEALGKLSSTVAREYTRIFGAITGYASSLLESLASNTSAYEDARKLLDAARLGHDVNRRILVIARASNAEGDINLQPVSLKYALTRAIEIAQPTISHTRTEVRFSESGRMPHVMADSAQLVDLLVDFLFNAAEAMPGGGQIRVSVHDQMVKRPDLKANPKAEPGPYAVIRIADTGSGMTPEVLEHLFEPFYTTKKIGGVGLGLSVANTAILGYGGWIRVRSKPDEGAEFHLFIPVAAPQAVARREERPLFLVIDHEADLLHETAAILKAEGFRVQTAESAADGLALYRKTPAAFTLCIVDAIMPDMETAELMRKLLEIKPAAPLVITSGFSRDYLRRFMPPCEWAFVQKPVERDALLGALHRILGDAVPLEAKPA